MAILTEDIKLLKSAVMNDVPEGGGAMTGIEVIDGQSNNMFSDTSAVDRAFGRWSARLVYGVAHTDDTDMALGAHAIITKAPDDSLVHCTLMRADWAEERDSMQSRVERYVVKGPRSSYRLYDTHYADSQQIRLISLVGGPAPAGGEGLVLRNPDGTEQFVRILRTETAAQKVAVLESGTTVLLDTTVVTCTISSGLDRDFSGPPAMRVGLIEADWAQVYTTNIAAVAKFYGIKPLAASAAPGDRLVVADGGIYTPLVPAATIESALVDQYPLTLRQSLSRTALRAVTLPAVTLALGSAVVLRLPTAAEPGSVALSHGGTAFADDGAGNLTQGSTPVGVINYAGKTITLNPGAPAYGTASCSITYRPATAASAATHSTSVLVTLANQGRVYTQALEPPPAPGTLTISYMAQERWYDLTDNGNGKISGLDSSHGTGSANYVTGTVAPTLGAIPDIGSRIIYQWGSKESAAPYEAEAPSRLAAVVDLPWGVSPATLTAAWSRGAVNYTATCSALGVLSGNASGVVQGVHKPSGEGGYAYVNELVFEPTVLPDGPVALRWSYVPETSSTATGGPGGDYMLASTPVMPGSISFAVAVVAQAGYELPVAIDATDDGSGVLIARNDGNTPIGSINYTTGALHINAMAALNVNELVVKLTDGATYYTLRELRTGHTVELLRTQVVGISHRKAGSGAPGALSVTPAQWGFTLLPVGDGLRLHTGGLVFQAGGDVYHSAAGVLSRGWSIATAATTSAGSVSDTGRVVVTAPPASGANSLQLVNASIQRDGGMTVGQGVFRIASAPIKTGVFQIQAGALVGTANEAGVISGDGWSGDVDFQRGIVQWQRLAGYTSGYSEWQALDPISADALSYNAVYLQYLPLDKDLLGIDTVRLPLDGKVPIYRSGDLLVVHNTLTTQLPNPLVKGTAYSLARERIASMRVKDALGALVPSSLYVSDLDPGTITVPSGSDLTPFTQPLNVEHRIEDMMVCAQADISGQLKFTSTLTHAFPAESSFVSSALMFGDLFARAYNYVEQATWTGEWSDELVGAAPSSASFNSGQYQVTVTNRGAINERWVAIRTNTTDFKVIGENVGDIGTGNTGEDYAPLNPATGVPYFTLPALGWGNGWSIGNVLRFSTAACGAPFGVVRTVLQGPATLDSDVFSLAFRVDVNRP